MDYYFKQMLVQNYNRNKESDTKYYYLENGNIVKVKKNGKKQVYHYDYLEKMHRGFINNEELHDAIDYIKCILDVDEDDDKALSSYVELWSNGMSTYHHEWKNIPINTIVNDREQFEEILKESRNDNLFITPNTFNSSGHKMNSLMSINAITIDLDYKKKKEYKDYEPEAIIKILEDKYFFGNVNEIALCDIDMLSNKVPKPNFIEYSNQIRLIYLVDKIKLSKKGRRKMLKFVKAIKLKMEKRLKDFGADSTPNLNSFIRVPFSYNVKKLYKTNVTFENEREIYTKVLEGEDRYKVFVKEYSRQRYDIQNIADLFNSREQVEQYFTLKNNKQRKVCKIKNAKEKKTFVLSSFNLERLKDIEKLQLLKNEGLVEIHRESLCFAYMVHLKLYGYKYDEIISRMEYFISKFNDTSNARTLISKCKNVMKNNYKFTSEGIRNFFGLSESFCIAYELKSFTKRLYTKEYRREYAREYYKEYLSEGRKFKHLSSDMKDKIIDMNKDGKSVTYIAKKIGCKLQTVYNHLKNEVNAFKVEIQKSIEDAQKLISEGATIKQASIKLGIK